MTLTCHRCRYQWTPRTAAPKECPNCKARLARARKPAPPKR